MSDDAREGRDGRDGIECAESRSNSGLSLSLSSDLVHLVELIVLCVN